MFKTSWGQKRPEGELKKGQNVHKSEIAFTLSTQFAIYKKLMPGKCATAVFV